MDPVSWTGLKRNLPKGSSPLHMMTSPAHRNTLGWHKSRLEAQLIVGPDATPAAPSSGAAGVALNRLGAFCQWWAVRAAVRPKLRHLAPVMKPAAPWAGAAGGAVVVSSGLVLSRWLGSGHMSIRVRQGGSCSGPPLAFRRLGFNAFSKHF